LSVAATRGADWGTRQVRLHTGQDARGRRAAAAPDRSAAFRRGGTLRTGSDSDLATCGLAIGDCRHESVPSRAKKDPLSPTPLPRVQGRGAVKSGWHGEESRMRRWSRLFSVITFFLSGAALIGLLVSALRERAMAQ